MEGRSGKEPGYILFVGLRIWVLGFKDFRDFGVLGVQGFICMLKAHGFHHLQRFQGFRV